jgi:TolA-binding protein
MYHWFLPIHICMKTPILVIFILALTVGWTLVFSAARLQYSGIDRYRQEASLFRERLNQQTLKTALVEVQMREFQQQVATLMPNSLSPKAVDFPMRSLASSLKTSEGLPIKLMTANQLMERGKADFRKQDFSKANQSFKTVIDLYSYSPDVIEAYFLYSEGLYQQRNFETCVQTIHAMIELFPASELTGFAMMRLGRILEIQKRSTEALEVYKTVVRSFPQRDLASQASESIRLLEL